MSKPNSNLKTQLAHLLQNVQNLKLQSKKQPKIKTRSKSERRRPKVGKQLSNKLRLLAVHKAVAAVKAPAAALREAQRKMALFKSGYFDKDVKENVDMKNLQTTIDNATKEIALIKQVMSTTTGDRPVRFRLSQTMTITTTVTTGVTTNVKLGGTTTGPLSPSLCDEWGSLILLFDEYKCTGGCADFGYFNAVPASTLNANAQNSMPVIAFDPEDTTVLTSTQSGSQLNQHMLIATTFSNVDYHPEGKTGSHHVFRYHVPPGTLSEPSTGTQLLAGTQWIPVVEPAFHGYLKFFHIGQIVSATITGAGINFVFCEFRSRA